MGRIEKQKRELIEEANKRVLSEQTEYDKTQTTEKDGVTTITQSYTLIDDPSNPGTQVKGTIEQAKDYYNWYIKTDHPNPPTFEKFQVVWNKSKTKLNEGDIQRIVKRVLSEQEEKYLVSGTKFSMFGSHRIDIKVTNKTTGEIIISVGGEGSSEKEAYDKAVKEFNKKLKEKGLNLQPPTIDKLEKSN